MSDSKPSGTVCRHCGGTRWKVIPGDGCAVQDRIIPCPHCAEPTPAEQPRRWKSAEERGQFASNAGFEPAAASPAEGPRNSAIEIAGKRDAQILTKPIDWEEVETKCCEVAQPVPDAVKVEEIAEQQLNALTKSMEWYPIGERRTRALNIIAAILRPYFSEKK